MAIQLPRRKKIETLSVAQAPDWSNTQLSVRAPQTYQALNVVGAAPSAPQKSFLQNVADFGTDVVASVQQRGGKVADVGFKLGAGIEESANRLSPFKSDTEKDLFTQKLIENTENQRSLVKGIKDVRGQNLTGTSDDISAQDILSGDKQKIARLAGESLDVGLGATMFANPISTARNIGTNAANQGTRQAFKQVAKDTAKESAFFGTGDALATGTATYGETGDLNKSLQAGATAGVASALTQGLLQGAGAGAGYGLSRRTAPVSNISATQNPVQNVLDEASTQLATNKFTVADGLNIDPNIQRRLEEEGITSVNQRDNEYGAQYNSEDRSINLKDPNYATPDHIYHELGHDVFLNRLSPEDRALFADSRGNGYEQAVGRKGYKETDLHSEEFSNMYVKALKGEINDIPEKYRATVARYAKVALQEAEQAQPGGAKALVESVKQIKTDKKGALLPQVKPKQVDSPKFIDRITPQNALSDQQLLQAQQVLNRPQVQRREAPLLEQRGNNLPVGEQLALDAQMAKERYRPVSLKSKLSEAWNPYAEGAKMDVARAERLGIPVRDLPKTESMEALAEKTKNSGLEAQEFLRSSDTGAVVQKYGYNTPESQEFNAYRLYVRDLARRSDGREPLFRDRTPEQMQEFIADYELRNPSAQQDLMSLVADIRAVQDEAIRRGVVDAETVNAARNGSEALVYTPATRALPEETQRATINANGVAGGARQSIIQDLQGSDIPLDPSFDSITDYVNTAYRQMAKAQTSQQFARNVREGLVPGARFIDTTEMYGARKAMRDEQKATGKAKNMNDYAELMPDPTTGLQVITGREAGKPFKIEVTPEQARFLQGLGEEKMNKVLDLAKKTQTPFRTVLTGTLNFPFQVISSAWNGIMSPTLSPQGLRVYSPKAIAESFKSLNGNSEFQQMLRSGGAQQFTGNLETSGKLTTAEALAAEADLASKFKFNATDAGRAWRMLDKPGAKLEGMQRTGIAKAAYDARLRKNGTPEEALADAVYAYNNVLPNFGRMSSAVRQIDSVLMYGGASQAGTRSLLTALKRDPVGVGTRLAVLTTGLTALTANSLSQENAQEFYQDMNDSGKGYIIQNNGIIVLPGAHKVTKEEASQDPTKREGEWLGIVKIPLPPEVRPIQNAIQAQMVASAKGENVPLGTYAQALFDFTTGGARTLSNPATDLAYGLATNVDRYTGREIVPREMQRKPIEEQKYSTTSPLAVELGKTFNVSPLKVDYLLSKGGLPGQTAKGIGTEKGPAGSTADAVASRFTNTFGQKESTKFYNKIDEIAQGIKSDDDMKAFEALHAQKDAKSLDKTAERYKTLLARPAVFEAERQLDAYNRSQGKVGNPIFDLAPDQQEKVFRYRASKDLNAAKQAYDKNGNPLFTSLGLDEKWYDDFRNAETAFYDSVKSGDSEASVLSYSGAKKPQASPELQQKLDYYYTLPSGTGDRSRFLQGNPDVLEHWAAGDQFTNAERIAVGLKPTVDAKDSGGSSFAGRSGGKRGGGSGGGGGGAKILNPRARVVSINAGGKIAKPTVSVQQGKKGTRKYTPRKGKSLPKVTLKKSKV